MAEILGFTTPAVNITGFISSSWIYVFIIGIIGLVLIVALSIFLFSITYNRRVVLFENLCFIFTAPQR